MKPGVSQRQREAASSNSPTRQIYKIDCWRKKCLPNCTRRPNSPEETCSTFVLVCGWVAPAALLMYCGNVFSSGFRVAGQMCRKKSRSPRFLYTKPCRHAQPHQTLKHVLPFFFLLGHDRYSVTRPYQSFWTSLAGDHVVFSTVTGGNLFQLPNPEIAVLASSLYCYWWQPAQLQEKPILAIFPTVTSWQLFPTSSLGNTLYRYQCQPVLTFPNSSSNLFSLLLLVVGLLKIEYIYIYLKYSISNYFYYLYLVVSFTNYYFKELLYKKRFFFKVFKSSFYFTKK